MQIARDAGVRVIFDLECGAKLHFSQAKLGSETN
jgi:hypothetical protein